MKIALDAMGGDFAPSGKSHLWLTWTAVRSEGKCLVAKSNPNLGVSSSTK